MAIQLPRIQKNDVINATPLPEAQAIGAEGAASLAKGNVKLIEAAGKGVVDVTDAYQKAYDNAAKDKAKELSNKYNIAVDDLTAKFSALPLGGDLTEEWINVKKQQDENKKRAMELATSPLAKEYLKEQLDAQDAVLNRSIEMKYAQANMAYKVKNITDKNENLKRNFITQSAFFDPKDPTSYAPLDEALKGINDNSEEAAQSLDLVTRDSSGQPILPDAIKKDIKNSKSNAVRLSISSLINSGSIDKADALYKRYADLLSDTDRPVIEAKIAGASKKQKVYAILESVKNLPEKEAQDKIANLENDEIRDMTSAKYSSLKSREEAAKSRIEKDAEDKIYEYINNQSATGDSVESIEEVKNSKPELYGVIKNNPQAITRINNALNKRPYNSNFEQYDTAVDAIHSGEALNWNESQWRENTSELNSKDHSRLYNKVQSLKLNKTLSNGIKVKQATDVSAKVKLLLTGSALLPSKGGKLTDTGRKNWAFTIDNQVDEEISKLKPEDVTPANMEKTINRIINTVYSRNNVNQNKPKEDTGTRLLKNFFSID